MTTTSTPAEDKRRLVELRCGKKKSLSGVKDWLWVAHWNELSLLLMILILSSWIRWSFRQIADFQQLLFVDDVIQKLLFSSELNNRRCLKDFQLKFVHVLAAAGSEKSKSRRVISGSGTWGVGHDGQWTWNNFHFSRFCLWILAVLYFTWAIQHTLIVSHPLTNTKVVKWETKELLTQSHQHSRRVTRIRRTQHSNKT